MLGNIDAHLLKHFKALTTRLGDKASLKYTFKVTWFNKTINVIDLDNPYSRPSLHPVQFKSRFCCGCTIEHFRIINKISLNKTRLKNLPITRDMGSCCCIEAPGHPRCACVGNQVVDLSIKPYTWW